jgi:hypothetical protein
MPITINITNKETLSSVEQSISDLNRSIGAAASPQTGMFGEFEAVIASNWQRYLFKEQWCGIAISTGLRQAKSARVKASGLQEWAGLSDEVFQTSMPALLALQHGATLMNATGDELPDGKEVRQYVVDSRQGVLGTDSGHWRSIVEFDPGTGVAPALDLGSDPRRRLLLLVRNFLNDMKVGAIGRNFERVEVGYRKTALEFLLELHANGWEHASACRGIRTLKIAKHIYTGSDRLRDKASSFPELENYIEAQPNIGAVNLVEASVSDFGPGILGGFMASPAAERFADMPGQEVLDLLLHRKLSRKSGDPNAGLGILNALKAAKAMSAFVSLRTGEFWYVLDGSISGGEARLRPREGRAKYPQVDGTHWQILYPDLLV